MAAAAGWQGDVGLPADVVKGFLAISGLFDLRPLVASSMNEWLHLDDASAAASSPQLAPISSARAVVALAEHEAPGFALQASAFHERWSSLAPSTHHVVPDRNHFDVFLDLADASSLLARALVELVALSR